MKETPNNSDTRPHSARRQATSASAVPASGGPDDNNASANLDWTRARDSLKAKWVASVIAFWVSASILAVVLFIDGKLNLILTSITLGMLVIGVWLKTRYQLHLRKDPDRH